MNALAQNRPRSENPSSAVYLSGLWSSQNTSEYLGDTMLARDKIRAIIFDFDGLILDTETPIFRSWKEIFAHHGQELDIAIWSDCIGRSPETFDPQADLEALVAHRLDRAAIMERQASRETELIAQEKVLPGVKECLVVARDNGLRLAVASSSSRDWVVGHLSRLGLLSFFDAICCADESTQAKPSPDLYFLAAERLSAQTSQAIALEDSPHGVTAAKAAGIFCVAIPNNLTRNLSLSQADIVLDSLADMPLDELIAEAEKGRGR